jgi:molybdenum cofactor cytidylyltransferase
MGRDKALLPWPQSSLTGTFLSAAISLLLPRVDIVFVVAGKNRDVLAPVVYANGASLLVNPDSSRGQFSSLRLGLQEVRNHGRDCVIVTLVDRPPVRSETMGALQLAFERVVLQSLLNSTSSVQRKWAVIPEYNGRHGHPILLANAMIEALLNASEASNARDTMRAYDDKIEYLSVDDPFVALNVNTPEQYALLPLHPSL